MKFILVLAFLIPQISFAISLKSNSTTIKVNEAVPSNAPAWFVSQADSTWKGIATGASEKLASKVPSPVPHYNSFGDSPSSITLAWTGGAVDQTRGEYLLVANGGHQDYPGNEGYALSVRSATPAWRRLSDPTPNSQFGNLDNEGNGLFLDGRPRAMHSTFECFGDGRVWFPLQNSVASGGGGVINRVVAYNREFLGAGSSPLPWTSANLGPWELFNPVPFSSGVYIGNMIFGGCAFDPIGHKVWGLSGNSAGNTVYWSVETAGANLGKATVYQSNQSFGHWGGWLTVAHDLRILVAGDTLRQTVTVLDLASSNPGTAFTQVSSTGGGYYDSGSGGAYIQKNNSIAVGDPKNIGGSIRKLKIPTKTVNGKTVYDPAGQWAWSSLSPGGISVTTPSDGNGKSYTKWNVIEDMGNGQAAIIVLTDINGPTYIYKVPANGL